MRWGLQASTSKKYQVNIVLHRVDGLAAFRGAEEELKLRGKLVWKGPRTALGSRLKGRKSGWTSSVPVDSTGTVEWQEDFENHCVLTMTKDDTFQPWPVSLSLCKEAAPSILKTKPLVLGSVLLDLSELICDNQKTGAIIKLPFPCGFGGLEMEANFAVSVRFVEMRNAIFDGFESVHRFVAPAKACMGEPMWDSDDGKPTEIVRKKVRGLKGIIPSIISIRRNSTEEERHDGGKLSPSSAGKLSPRSVESPPDSTSSYDSTDEEDSDGGYEHSGAVVKLQKQFSYGTIAGANLVVEGAIPFHSEEDATSDLGDVISIHSRASTLAFSKAAVGEDSSLSTDVDVAHSSQGSLSSLFPWRKRKLSFRSPRARGEPLLNKAYGEEGGDEIDWDRRQSETGSPGDRLALVAYKGEGGLSSSSSNVASAILDFGDDLTFSVGSWETKELLSRDGQMKLSANVFYASFDQRSESAAGESACTALVAVVADWLHSHPTLMPSRAEFDMLIRDGSAEWRKLCEVEAYKDRFPDRHFDLETILQAQVRPLCIIPEKSFVGFFQPEGLGDSCDFLQGAMSFDGIWDEIERCGPALYIVSWNDHFFVLRMEERSCYIIDTLGERLYEGCNQAYILHFDEKTSLCSVPLKPTKDTKVPSDEGAGSADPALSDKSEKAKKAEEAGDCEPASECTEAENSSGETVHVGKSACREFIKGFFAALPLRELQIDVQKGLFGKAPLHHRLLQIEFHYVKPTSSMLGLAVFESD
ncbi:hypothetical protein R1sor_022385 [Riccia sorocarpa]|uniref:C2 NT-type domain-containing protein n=1 Tax=Riccia sorocarpa TaxID=122646 RepID=A0ABD3GQJ7_9MARC